MSKTVIGGSDTHPPNTSEEQRADVADEFTLDALVTPALTQVQLLCITEALTEPEVRLVLDRSGSVAVIQMFMDRLPPGVKAADAIDLLVKSMCEEVRDMKGSPWDLCVAKLATEPMLE